MIFYGIVLLIIGIIVWAVGRATTTPPAAIAGYAIGAIGVVLLLIGVVLYAIPAGDLRRP